MPRRTAYLGVVASGALLLAAPAAASAAITGTISKPCYSRIATQGSEPIVIALTGGTPGAGFVIAATAPGKALGSAGGASGDFDAAGNAVTQIRNVSPPSGSIDPIKGEPIAITIKEFAPGIPAVDIPIGGTLITNLSVDFARTPRDPRKGRRVSASGTAFAGQPVYGFIVKGTSKKVLRRFPLGVADACGFATAKAVIAPKRYRTGSYRLYVNAGAKLNKPLALYRTFSITRRFF